MKKIISAIMLLSFSLLLFTGCSEKDSDSSTGPGQILAYLLEQFLVLDDVLNLFHADDQQDILDDEIPVLNLFTIHVTASDGWSWRNQGRRDLKWSEFKAGYLIPEDEGRIYYEEFTNQGINAYNVKWAETVEVFRAFELIKPDNTIAIYELNGMDTEMVNNYDEIQEEAIKLTEFIPDDEITAIDSVYFIGADGYQKTYTPEEFEAGYWLLTSQRTIFPGLNLPGSKKKFKFLQQIKIFGDMEEQDDPFECNFSVDPDYQFDFPEDLEGYDSIIWEN
ncbi:MAG: hypothetical protein JXB60_03685 [Candidatus Cloacimonetes bacterium]|nr:hypothetical protein [Candidatus Cloacimonadota bacterium]